MKLARLAHEADEFDKSRLSTTSQMALTVIITIYFGYANTH